jgi:hypothetical protein
MTLVHMKNARPIDRLRATLDQAMAAKLDAGVLHWWMYYLAFLRNDTAQMEQQVASVAGKLGDEDHCFQRTRIPKGTKAT